MPSYILFFESPIIGYFDPYEALRRKTYIDHKIPCSFLEEREIKNTEAIQKILKGFFTDLKIIEFGRIELGIPGNTESIVFFIIFTLDKDLLDNNIKDFYLVDNSEKLKLKFLEIRDKLCNEFEISIAKRFISNIFLPEELKKKIHNNIEQVIKNKENKQQQIKYNYYQNFMKFPFLIELHTKVLVNFREEINRIINEYYDLHFPSFKKTSSLFVNEFSFFDLREYSLSLFDRKKVVQYITSSYIYYLYSLYIRQMHIIRNFNERVESISNELNKYSGKNLKRLKGYFIELKKILFSVFPNLYINVLDEYIIHNNNLQNPDFTYEIFNGIDDNVILFRRILKKLEENISSIQQKLETLLISKKDKINLYTRSELEEKLEKIRNENDFKDLLKKILKDLGFSDVTINCGRRGHDEFGKDIVFSHRNRFQDPEWDAVVVKIGKINQPEGRKLHNYIEEIIQKGSEALNIPFENEQGITFPITRVFIATNEIITDKAKKSIRANIEGNVFFIDRSTLLDLV